MIQKDLKEIILHVKVTPKSSREQIIGWENEYLKIKIIAVPEKGEANRALIRFLSKIFEIPQRDIILLKGETSRLKQFSLSNLTQKDFQERLIRAIQQK